MNNFKIGDKLYHYKLGWGIFKGYKGKDDLCDWTPNDCVESMIFTLSSSLLSFTKYDLIKGGITYERPKPDIKVGQLIYVKGISGINKILWHIRFVSRVCNDTEGIYCYNNQNREGGDNWWPEYSLTNPLDENNQFSKEDLKDFACYVYNTMDQENITKHKLKAIHDSVFDSWNWDKD